MAAQLSAAGRPLDSWSAATDGAEVTVRCTRRVRIAFGWLFLGGAPLERTAVAAPARRPCRDSGDGPRPGGVEGRRTQAWRVKDSNLRRLSRRIYSPLPLATRATRRAVVREQSTRTADDVPGAPRAHVRAAKRNSHGRRVLRRREQGRPPGDRQRPQPGGQGAVAAVRLPRHQRHHRLGRGGGGDPAGRHRGAGRRRAGRVQGEADQARHLAEVARRRRAPVLRQDLQDLGADQAGHRVRTTPRRSPS